jgi:hypothetical protein
MVEKEKNKNNASSLQPKQLLCPRCGQLLIRKVHDPIIVVTEYIHQIDGEECKINQRRKEVLKMKTRELAF